jgi:hypothetical protein
MLERNTRMKQSLLTQRRIIVGFVALMLVAFGIALATNPVAAQGSQVVQQQASPNTLTAASNYDDVMAEVARGIALGMTRTRTTLSNGIYRTEVTLSNGTTLTGCHDKLLNPIPCP